MTDEGATDVRIRPAELDDRTAVLSVLDGANLETDADAIRTAIKRGGCLVAESAGVAVGETVLVGALVRDGNEITHVAVRRRRRGQGIGTALVKAVTVECDELVAGFSADLSPFYASLGFEIVASVADDRVVGRRVDG